MLITCFHNAIGTRQEISGSGNPVSHLFVLLWLIWGKYNTIWSFFQQQLHYSEKLTQRFCNRSFADDVTSLCFLKALSYSLKLSMFCGIKLLLDLIKPSFYQSFRRTMFNSPCRAITPASCSTSLVPFHRTFGSR